MAAQTSGSLWFDSPDVASVCGFPGCTAKAFHEGEHQFKPAPIAFPPQPVYTCRECGSRFVIYGQIVAVELRTCGAAECILAASRRAIVSLPVMCTCRQRNYAHEIAVHASLKFEGPRKRWPWTLALSIGELGREGP